MENLVQQMLNALIQIALFAFLPFVWWLISARRKSPFLEWLGLKPLKMLAAERSGCGFCWVRYLSCFFRFC